MRLSAWPVMAGTIAALGTLAACTGGATTHNAPPSAASSASGVKTFSPLDGPTEDAAQLPKTCSAILTESDLRTVFGTTQSADNSYGKYAPLPAIGRTGRVSCGFGIGIDLAGNPTAPVVTVSVITYTSPKLALDRITTTAADSIAKGGTSRDVLVAGHPATIVAEPTAVPAATTASGTTSAPPSGGATPAPGTAGAPAPSTSAAAPAGDTELLMADGNRTFVIQIPPANASGDTAARLLTALAALVYQHTLPTAASPAAGGPSPSPSAS